MLLLKSPKDILPPGSLHQDQVSRENTKKPSPAPFLSPPAGQRPDSSTPRKTGALTQQAKQPQLWDWLSGQTSLKSLRLLPSQDGDALNVEGAWVLELHPGTS